MDFGSWVGVGDEYEAKRRTIISAQRVECRFADETLWMSQALMAELFQATPQNITQHLRALYGEGEIDEAATCKSYLQVRTEGVREVRRAVKHSNLDAILAVGYRVRSRLPTHAVLPVVPRRPGGRRRKTRYDRRMMMKHFLTCVVAFLAIFGTVTARAAEPDAEALLREGIALYDAGRFEEALARFEAGLGAEPENPVLLYEKALALNALQRCESCAEVARRAAKVGEDHSVEMQALAMEANCLDSAGESRAAVRRYRKALRRYPDAVPLHFNLGVALAGRGEYEEAREELLRAVELEPRYASAVMLYSQVCQSLGWRGEALLGALRFLMLERGTARSADMARRAAEMPFAGLEIDGPRSMRLTISGEGDLRPLEMFLPLAATSAFVEESDESESEPKEIDQRVDVAELVEVWSHFVQMAIEAEGQGLEATAVHGPLFALQHQGHLEAFGYRVAAEAGVKDAAAWLEASQNALALVELDQALRRQ